MLQVVFISYSIFSKPALCNSYVELGNILSWKGTTRITQSNSRTPQNVRLCLSAVPGWCWALLPSYCTSSSYISSSSWQRRLWVAPLMWWFHSCSKVNKAQLAATHGILPTKPRPRGRTPCQAGVLQIHREWNLFEETLTLDTSSLLTWLKRERGCSCSLENSSPGTESPLELKAACLSSGIAEFPLLCFIPQTSTD